MSGAVIDNGVVVMEGRQDHRGRRLEHLDSIRRHTRRWRAVKPPLSGHDPASDSTLGLNPRSAASPRVMTLSEMGDFNGNIRAEVAVNGEATNDPRGTRANGITHAVTVIRAAA